MFLISTNNILFKDAESLENLGKVKTIIFDKTGTITKGSPVVEKVTSCGDLSQEEVLKIVASIEKNSEHPLAEAIVNDAKNKKINLLNTEEFISYTGLGVKGKIDGKEGALTKKAYKELQNKYFFRKKDKQAEYYSFKEVVVIIL